MSWYGLLETPAAMLPSAPSRGCSTRTRWPRRSPTSADRRRAAVRLQPGAPRGRQTVDLLAGALSGRRARSRCVRRRWKSPTSSRDLFDTKESVILTSATLSAEGSFDFLRERVGLEDADELLLGSPFDFPSSTLIALPTDLPEPNEPDFVAAMSELLIEACRASGGRALVLFTSYGMLNAYLRARSRPPLEAEGILVLGHGIDGSPRQMLAALRENPRTVLLGTASFWEGVDVAGEALSLLVIVRLPFAVPTDPIYQARCSLYDEPFDQYALPQAVLRFRQGFGRLIRTKTDRGVLLVLDGASAPAATARSSCAPSPAAPCGTWPRARSRSTSRKLARAPRRPEDNEPRDPFEARRRAQRAAA